MLPIPPFFESNAIDPIEMMPRWLQMVSPANPLTYGVDALRDLMLTNGVSSFGIGVDLAVLTASFAGRLPGRSASGPTPSDQSTASNPWRRAPSVTTL